MITSIASGAADTRIRPAPAWERFKAVSRSLLV